MATATGIKLKFDSAEAYCKWIGEHGWLTPGQEVLSEDGNTYIVCGDGMSLKTSDGVYVCALKLDPYINQKFAELACNVEETLEDIDPDKTLFPGNWAFGEEWAKKYKNKFPTQAGALEALVLEPETYPF